MIVAVVDLGTNTCNLLIAKIEAGGFEILCKTKELVKLGDEKIRTNEISLEATERVVNAFRKYNTITCDFRVSKVQVVATSATRSAKNREQFLKALMNKTGWDINIISGEEEAELIFKGVLLALKVFKKPSVILDIGGGSNEIILGNANNILWKESRPSGIGRVINRFTISDPIQFNEIKILQQFFLNEHRNGIQQCKNLKVKTLIGCSGAFDTIADIIDEVNPNKKQRITQQIGIEEFYRIYEKLLKSKREDRLIMKGMDMVRVDLIVPAVILIETLIAQLGISEIVQTSFALSEGILSGIIDQKIASTADE